MNENGWPGYARKHVASGAVCEEGDTLAFYEYPDGQRMVVPLRGKESLNHVEVRAAQRSELAAAVVFLDAERPGAHPWRWLDGKPDSYIVKRLVGPDDLLHGECFPVACNHGKRRVYFDEGVPEPAQRPALHWLETGEWLDAPAPKPPMPEAVKALAEGADDVAETLHKCGFQCTAQGLRDLARAAEAEYQEGQRECQ